MADFNLETAVATWRQFHERQAVFTAADLDELERHLRDHTAQRVAAGIDESAAFREAMQKLGDVAVAEAEYRKVRLGKVHRERRWRDELRWYASMVRSYTTVARRAMGRERGYVALNVMGLAIGLACCFVIASYIRHETSYDTQHPNADHLYRLVASYEEGGVASTMAYVPLPTLDVLEQVLGIAQSSTTSGLGRAQVERLGQTYYQEDLLSADDALIEMFGYTVIERASDQLLEDAQSIVLTGSLAQTWFGDASALGETVTLGGEAYTVTGVLADPPSPTHLPFQAVRSVKATRMPPTNVPFAWMMYMHSYLLMEPEADIAQAEQVINNLMAPKTEEAGRPVHQFRLQPVTEIHLNHQQRGEAEAGGSVTLLYVLGGVAVLILLIAMLNFVNLGTARASRRLREVGVRKTFGAHRRQLAMQFLVESILMVLGAGVLAVGLVLMLAPLFNTLSGADVTLRLAVLEVALLLGSACVVGLLVGMYPAALLAKQQTISALKGRFGQLRRGRLRYGLVVLQFTISSAFLIATALVYQQVSFLQTRDLGFEHERLLTFTASNVEQQAILKEQLLALPAVQHVTTSMGTPGVWAPDNVMDIQADDATESVAMHWLDVDADFLRTYDVDLVQGRDLRVEEPEGQSLLLNEVAVQQLGWDDPIGRTIEIPSLDYSGTVVGVVRDFHHTSLHEAIGPTLIRNTEDMFRRTVTVRYQTAELASLLADVRAIWQPLHPDRPFEYEFVDDAVAQHYAREEQIAQIATASAVLAALVACLGLFGLAAYATSQRTKEIGVRKVLGASVPQVVRLISADFLKPVGFAFVLAAPLAYWGAQQWLGNFAYRIEIGIGLFIAVAVLVLAVALLTVSYQSVKAALADPVKSLRYE
ncbi:MAG: ABC transporter permease [Bacteroidota bacterium]